MLLTRELQNLSHPEVGYVPNNIEQIPNSCDEHMRKKDDGGAGCSNFSSENQKHFPFGQRSLARSRGETARDPIAVSRKHYQ